MTVHVEMPPIIRETDNAEARRPSSAVGAAVGQPSLDLTSEFAFMIDTWPWSRSHFAGSVFKVSCAAKDCKYTQQLQKEKWCIFSIIWSQII